MESLCQNSPNSFITWKLRTTRGSQTFHLDCLVFLTLLSAAFYWFLQSSVELRNILNTLNWKHTLALNSKLLLGKLHVKLKWKSFTPFYEEYRLSLIKIQSNYEECKHQEYCSKCATPKKQAVRLTLSTQWFANLFSRFDCHSYTKKATQKQ